MDSSESIYAPPNIVLLTAPQLFGVMFNWGLWGILTAQVYIYYLFFTDSIHIRVLVYTLYVLECLQLALSSADIFFWFSRDWGKLNGLFIPHFAPIDMCILAGVVSVIVQLYFTWRIWHISSSIILPLIIAAISIAQGVAGIVAGAQTIQAGSFEKIGPLIAPRLWLGGAALADTMIAASLCFYLYRAGRNSKIPRTKYMLKRIIALTIETNVLTASMALLTLILYVKFKDNTLYLCPPSALTKLYTNTVLVVFNNRIPLPRDTPTIASGAVRFMESTQPERTYVSTQSRSTSRPGEDDSNGGIEVKVTTEVDAVRDFDNDLEANARSRRSSAESPTGINGLDRGSQQGTAPTSETNLRQSDDVASSSGSDRVIPHDR